MKRLIDEVSLRAVKLIGLADDNDHRYDSHLQLKVNYIVASIMGSFSGQKMGLSEEEARARLAEYGYNELPTSKPKSVWRIMLEVVKEPLFILLLACGVLYLTLGDYTEGITLLCWVIVIILITFIQHRKTEKSLEALRRLSSPRAMVVRDGKYLRIAGREVVPGDVVTLSEGDRIPADAEVLESNGLTVDESLLTGESVPVLKYAGHPTDDRAVIFSGTLVVQGSGIAHVMATGIRTRFGSIGESLGTIEKSTSPLQREMKVLIRNLFLLGALVSTGVVAAFYFTRGNLLESMLSGLAAAMALLPEEFPVVFTIFLALGAWRLSRRRVLTRNPSAIETLGSATVLCSDKTGTITQNKMEITSLAVGLDVIHKSNFENRRDEFADVIGVCFDATRDNSVDPMERAVYAAHEKYSSRRRDSVLLREYPLSQDFFAMTRVMQEGESGVKRAYCKGAPEAVLELCGMQGAGAQALLEVVHKMATEGLRVIAVAKADHSGDGLPDSQRDFSFSFVGLVGFEDPVRDEVPEALRECREAGIKVIMITGDYPETARSIATQIGLPSGVVLTGSDLQKLSEQELRHALRTTHVFARIRPEQKLQIIHALKANGEVVAMTGDGVNDAPALKAADIGVSMGLKGTDVAREASSLVLLDDNFASIVAAIRSGRVIFDNLQKAMSYIIAIHIPIIGLVLLPALLPFLPVLLMPMHIVFMELIIDPVCSIAFESEQEEKGVMRRPPRNIRHRFFGWQSMLWSVLQGLVLMGMVVVVYFLAIQEGHGPGEVRAIAFSALIVGNVFFILTSLSRTRGFVSVVKEGNAAALLISAVALLLLLLTISVPFLRNLFSFEFPGYRHFIISLAGGVCLLVLLESIKYVIAAHSMRRPD